MISQAEGIAATRFGTGFRPGLSVPADAPALLAELRAARGAPLVRPVASTADRTAHFLAFRAAKQDDREGDEARRIRDEARAWFKRDAVERILQRAFSPHGFFERLAGFWADHFTVAARGAIAAYLVPAFEPEAIRPHLAGPFADLLKAAALHPAMLVYLDQNNSAGPGSVFGQRSGRGLNENLAREVLELHTLGAGGPYTQDDVRQFAELLTGYRIDLGAGTATFNERWAEPGAETVLGRDYGGRRANAGDAAAFLDDLAVHPGTAAHIARKLAVHFVSDDPPAALVAHIEAAWNRSGGDLAEVYAALLEHPAAWVPERAKIRRPQEIIAAAIRASGARPDEIDPDKRDVQAGIIGSANRMNQDIFRAPGPDGWPEEAGAWITPQGLAARLDWAQRLGHVFADRGLDPRKFADAAIGPLLGAETEFLVNAAAEKWEGIALALASPEFNRR